MAANQPNEYEDHDLELLSRIEREVLARGKLRLPARTRIQLISTVVPEVLNAHANGHEWVGAQGGLRYNPECHPTTGEVIGWE